MVKRNTGRRVRAGMLLLAQLICFIALARGKPDLSGPVIQVFIWSNDARLWILTLCVQNIRQFAQALLIPYAQPATIHDIVAAILLLTTILINSLLVALILTPGIPIACIFMGLLSGTSMALKSLVTTLITSHTSRPQYKRDAAEQHPQTSSRSGYNIYAFDRGWQVETLVAENLSAHFHTVSQWWLDVADMLSGWIWGRNGFIVYWARLMKVGCQLASLIQYVLAIELGAISTCLYTMILLLWEFSIVLCVAFFLAAQEIHKWVHHIFLYCPACYKDIAAPIYLCPTCQTEYAQLQPGIYGILTYRCTGCDTKLPTLNGRARQKLSRLCPHCRHPLHGGTGQDTTMHIALVGGSSAGKTTYLLAAIHELIAQYTRQDHIHITFLDSLLETLGQQTQSGDGPPPTTEVVPQAYTLTMQRASSSRPFTLYFYDPAGNTFLSDDTVGQQDYYRNTNAFLFIIDPLTLSTLSLAERTAHPGDLEIMQMYERVMQKFEAAYGLNKRKRYSQPVAIVLSKGDIYDLTTDVSSAAHQQLMINPSSSYDSDAMRQLVRTFLADRGLTPFMRDIEAQFTYVEYFACSANTAFQQPQNAQVSALTHVSHPLLWLLTHTAG